MTAQTQLAEDPSARLESTRLLILQEQLSDVVFKYSVRRSNKDIKAKTQNRSAAACGSGNVRIGFWIPAFANVHPDLTVSAANASHKVKPPRSQNCKRP